MSLKLILCPFRGEVRQLNALVSAFQVAQAHKAAVRVLHVATPAPIYPYAIGMSTLADAAAGLDVTLALLDAAERELIEQGKAYVSRYAKQAELVLRGEGAAVSGPPNGSVVFRVAVGSLSDYLPTESRSSDLIVIGFDNRPDGDLAEVIGALHHTQRPVLLVPQTPGAVVATDGRPKTIAIAWDGSSACAQAIRDAMPFLVMATDVTVIRVGEGEDGTAHAEADLKTYLESHGVAAEFIHIPHNAGSVGEILLAQANKVDARLLVMGAYGHGHVAEMVLGGATDYVLKHSHLPLLMAR